MFSIDTNNLPPEVLQLVRATLESLASDATAARQRLGAARVHLPLGVDRTDLDQGLAHVVSLHEQVEGVLMMLSADSGVGANVETTG